MCAVPLAVLRTSGNPWLNWPVLAFTYLFRGTPLLVQLYMIYFGVTLIEGIQETMWWAVFDRAYYPCLIAFALNPAAYTTEIIRGAIAQTPHGEIEAAQALGMSRVTIMRRITLPSAFRRVIPAYSNEVILMLHGSAIASTVTIVDLLGAARDINAKYYAPFEAFVFVALIYLCLTFAILASFRKLERRFMRHLRPM